MTNQIARLLRPASFLLGASALLLASCQQQQSSLPVSKPSAPAPAPAPVVPAEVESTSQAVVLNGFSDQVPFQNLTNPIAVRFASNGKVFVAEENGRIYFFDNLSDTTPTLFADLRGQVNSYWDRGLLGFTLDPNYATNGFVYVLYDHDAAGSNSGDSIFDRNASDSCPSPPGGTSDGCVTYGRISRITDPGAGYPITARLDMLTEWPQQFPSHSIGALNFGPDGKLYATGGDGASFGAQDYGNWGIPKNPLADPPGGFGNSLTAPTSRGGSLRAQSLRRPAGENVVLNGTLIRVDPTAGAPAAAGNPNLSHPDDDAKRIIAIGLRNPYRFTFHPTTGDVWIADVGANAWEEIDRLPAPLTATPIKNFGWPCWENQDVGGGKNWDTFDMCKNLPLSATVKPHYAYAHDAVIYSGDGCTSVGSSAISGIAFYPPSGAGNYPSTYRNALFFADVTRKCIWYMTPDGNGLPSVASRKNFITSAGNPVDLQIGPNNDLFYVDYGGSGGTGTNVGAGKIHRVRYKAPEATFTANPSSGFAPLAVQFTNTSTPGTAGDTLTYAWDLDGDGQYDDSTAKNPSRTYTVQATVPVRLKVTDQNNAVGESQPVNIVVGSTTTPPNPVIDTPTSSLTWKVGDNITFSGHATDVEDGTIPDSGLQWQVVIQHCPASCHPHIVQSFDGVPSGSFPAPDHEYPSYLQLVLTATDSHGISTTVSIDLQPQTVNLSFLTNPSPSPGLDVGLNLDSFPAPVTRTVIKGSFNTIAVNDQIRGNTQYTFQSWSDGGSQNHAITASAPATFTANFTTAPIPWTSQDIGAVMPPAGTWNLSGGVHTIEGGGADIWGTADEFRFTYRQVSGDATITARVTELENTNAFAKAGVMFRQSLNADSVNVHALISPVTTSGYRFIKRLTAGATSSSEVVTPSPLPGAAGWVRVKRVGDVFTAYSSSDGTTFTQLGTPQTIVMGAAVFVGMAVTSHADGTLATAKFDNVTVTTPAPQVPAAPTGLVATPGNGQVSLAWTASSGATSYTVKRGLSSGGPYTDFTQPNVSGTSYTDTTNVVNGTPYFYVVTASNANGQSGDSNQAQATPNPPPPPAAPTNLVATAGNGQVSLTWTASSGATSYTVKRGHTDTGPYDDFTQSNITTTSFTNTGLPNGATVYYVVTASNANGQSGDSNQAQATPTLPPPPPAPTGLAATAGNAQVSLVWTAASGATSYTVKRGLVDGGPYDDFVSGSVSGTSYTDTTNVVNGVTYFYVVTASNAGGESGKSNQAQATPVAPQPPAAPTNLVATGGVGQASLTWTDNAGNETGFEIERKLQSDPDTSFAQVKTAGANATGTSDSPVPAGTYTYRVRATNAVGPSGYSNTSDATVTVPSGPAAPTNLVAAVANGTTVNLTWVDNANNETGFRVERKVGAGVFASLATKTANTTTHSDAGPFTAGTVYTYRVIATGSPDSAASNDAAAIIGNPAADGFVRSGTSAGLNYGAALTLEAKTANTSPDTTRRAFLRFALTGVQATVTSAKLRLFGHAVTTAKLTNVHSVADTAWVEGTGNATASTTSMTWNYPSANAGGPAMSPAALSGVTVGLTDAWFEWDVTAYIQAQKTAGAALVTLGVKSGVISDEGQMAFNSREGTQKPVLVITSKP